MQLHFGSSRRLLYGVFSAAATPRRRQAVLVLNPWGWEALRAHRTLATLAGRLAGDGTDVLRFDYSSTGDSLGETADASWQDWLEDAELALDELMAVSGVRRVSLVGLRLGGLVAAALTARRSAEVDRVVLWAPPRDGTEAVAWARSAPGGEGDAFPVRAGFEEEIREADLGGLEGHAGPVLFLAGSGFTAPDVVDIELLPLPPEESPCWVEDRDHGAGAVPIAWIDRISRWLAS